MSRQRKRGKPPSAALVPLRNSFEPDQNAVSADVSDRPSSAGSPAPRTRRPLFVALALAGGWLLVLLGMVLFTANPPAVDASQLGRAEYAVVARLSPDEPGQILVERDLRLRPNWTEPLKPGPLKVANLEQASGATGEGSYLVPLSRSGEEYRVPPPPRPQSPPRVYPAVPAVLERVEQVKTELQARHR